MRTTKSLFLTLALGLFATYAFAQISGTKHDFSEAAWNDNTSGEICNACHSPHHGNVAAEAPLWNRGTTISGFTAYSSTTFNADDDGTGSGGTGAAYVAAPSGVSLLCLTCHDGVQLLDAYGGGDVTTTMSTINGGVSVRDGGDDEHPISINYTTFLVSADGGLHDIATASTRLSAEGTVECSSCHDVHNALNINNGTYLLADTNAGSALCLTCHNK